jgi:hypothetical protein
MAKTFIDGLIADEEYNRQKRLLESLLESLVMRAVDSARRPEN